jgi:hypothetical protein
MVQGTASSSRNPKNVQNSLDRDCEKSYFLTDKTDEEIRIKFVMYFTDKFDVGFYL